MENTKDFVLDDGLQKITFKNKFGEEFAELYFNPADTSIIERYEKVVDVFNNIQLKHETTEEVKESILLLSETFKTQFDYLLNRDNSDSLFRVYSPVTIFADGDYFAEKIIECISQLIEKEFNVRLKKKAKKIEKYTKMYHK